MACLPINRVGGRKAECEQRYPGRFLLCILVRLPMESSFIATG